MVLTSEHTMRPECAIEFGKIQAEREALSVWRADIKGDLNSIKKEILTLTGNGNRGKIDALQDDLGEIRRLLAEVSVTEKTYDERLSAVETSMDKFNNQMWSLGFKLGTIIGTLTILSQIVMKFL